MTHSMFNPQPNYSGVTIQISNPAVNVTPSGYDCCSANKPLVSGGHVNQYQRDLYKLRNNAAPTGQNFSYATYPQSVPPSYIGASAPEYGVQTSSIQQAESQYSDALYAQDQQTERQYYL